MIFINEEINKDLKGIYSITNKTNGKMYIGKTEDRFIERYWNHRWKLNKQLHENEHLERSWNKYGQDNFEFSVIHVLTAKDDINELEKYYINLHDSIASGYNMTTGGEGAPGYVLSDEARKIIGEKNRVHGLGRKATDSTRAKMRSSSRRLSPSKELLEKLRLYHTGKKLSETTKQKLRELNTGSKHPIAKLCEKQVEEIKCKLMEGRKRGYIAKEYNVSCGAISSISTNRSWTHVNVDGWEEYSKYKHYAPPNRILSIDDVKKIKTLLEDNIPAPQIAKQFKVKPSTIYNIKYNKYNKKHTNILYDNPVPSE